MKHLFPLSLILAFFCATANLRAQTILPLITDSLTFIDPVEIRFSPLEREISGTVIPHLQSISYGPDKFCLRVSAFRLPGALKFSIAFCIQLYKLDYPSHYPTTPPSDTATSVDTCAFSAMTSQDISSALPSSQSTPSGTTPSISKSDLSPGSFYCTTTP